MDPKPWALGRDYQRLPRALGESIRHDNVRYPL